MRKVGVSLLFVSALLGGCTTADAPNSRTGTGPVHLSTDPGKLCVSRFNPAKHYTHGFEVIVNEGSQPAEISAVSLLEPTNVEVSGAALLPVLNQTLTGSMAGWPPGNAAWVKRLQGMHLPGNSEFNLVVEIIPKEGASNASFSGVRVTYSVGNTSHSTTSNVAVEFRKRC